jgi:hypothetical protein
MSSGFHEFDLEFNEVHCPHLYMYVLSREKFIQFFFFNLCVNFEEIETGI